MIIPDLFINHDGFVTIQPNANPRPGEGNGWLQTGLAVACGARPPAPEMLRACRKSPTNPLIWRSPWKVNPGDETQCDDYWGALLISRPWAQEILAYGKAHWWCFDIGGQGRFKYWFGRFLPFASFVKVCAGERPNRLEAFCLALYILFSAYKISNADGNMKAYCVISRAQWASPWCAWAAKIWNRRIRARYGFVGLSWAEYFGPDHPMNSFNEVR